MLLTLSPWIQIPGIKSLLRRPARRKAQRWTLALEPMEIRLVLSPTTLTAQVFEVATPTATTPTGEFRAGQVSANSTNGSNLQREIDLSVVVSFQTMQIGYPLFHGAVAVLEIESVIWSISFSSTLEFQLSGHAANPNSGLAMPSRTIVASNSLWSSSPTDTVSTDVFARSSGVPRAAFETSVATSQGVVTLAMPSPVFVSSQVSVGSTTAEASLRKPIDLGIPFDPTMLQRLLENLNPRRPNRLIDGPIGDDYGRKARMLESPATASGLPELTPLSLPIWDYDSSIPSRPNSSDEKSPDSKKPTDEKKSTNEKSRGEKVPNDSNQNPKNDADEKKEPEAERDAAPNTAAIRRPRAKFVRTFPVNRPTAMEEGTEKESVLGANTPSRLWWEAFVDPTVLMSGIMSVASLASVWEDTRKRKDYTPPTRDSVTN